ncbi:S1 RNA-binding domain-containing protein [Aureliella helgolandensis]|uniref:30S ribosomal protein S1 n=1 Tax=Aureliella helgolandensis TaxID=2527968 RepID=A0A518G5C8_9BACT|nr:S1 RNA-binding domain-containing protein [Aureliella helgolandensis]QDV23792.1 30S ribosomal protein S1 [Aureliella helgolandensis]
MSDASDSQPATPETAAETNVDTSAAEGALPTEQSAVPTSTPEASSQAPKEESSPAAENAAGGPISLAKIREMRQQQQRAQPASQPAKTAVPAGNAESATSDPSSAPTPSGSGETAATATPTGNTGGAGKPGAGNRSDKKPRDRKHGLSKRGQVIETPPVVVPKVEVPSRRRPLSQDMEDELEAALAASDLDSMLIGDSMLQVGKMLEDGQRLQAKVMKAQGEFVFLSLGGANEAVIPALQFEELPEEGTQLDVIVRGFLPQEGLYEVTVPGNAVDVADWSDLNEGDVVEAVVTGSNTGGLECKVGSIDGFIPASQASEFRIENLEELVGQKLLCIVNEANPRRGNLVLSHRAVLEREKKEKREERLANLEVGAAVEGIVRKILDFGAFVDIGGLDGLLHISQLSWERIKHPSEILTEGDTIQVRVDKIDPQSGKIGLSYRSLQEDPWSKVDAEFPVGALIHGTVTRIAEFGAFVRIATGVEGLIHVSELAHHRVHSVGSVVEEGQELEVKVLSVDSDQQRISLSLKAAQAAPAPAENSAAAEAVEEPPAKPVLPKHEGPLKGGTARPSGGEQFGLKW